MTVWRMEVRPPREAYRSEGGGERVKGCREWSELELELKLEVIESEGWPTEAGDFRF